MHTMGPWKVGKKVGDKVAVVTTNPVDGRPPRGDDMERYGGTPICLCSEQDARLIAVAPDMHALLQKEAGMNDDVDSLLERIHTGLPL